MPILVNLTTPAADTRRGSRRPPEGGWTPFTDWTGHDYKPPSQCRVDYGMFGRDVMRGKSSVRRMPSMPGSDGWIS